MRLNRRTVKKLASLSALGAGALTLATEKADASIITTTVNTTVGFSIGSVASWGSGILPGAASASFFFRRTGGLNSASKSGSRSVYVGANKPFVKFPGHVATLSVFSAGAKMGAAIGTIPLGVGARIWSKSTFTSSTTSGAPTISSSTFHSKRGNGSFTDKFALFTYTGTSGPLYGWVELSYAVTDTYGGKRSFGPDLTIIEYAVDNSGAQIAAGDTGESAIAPEPSAIYMSGLGALVLGAEGLRRWRAARKQDAVR